MGPLTSTRLKAPGSIAAFFDDVYRRGMTDGLPVIPPTAQAVAQMLEYARIEPDEPVAVIAPNNALVTAEKTAINAVMAGCLPDYFPVVLAALKAVAEPGFNLLGIQATTNPVAPVFIINGPVRKTIDVNCGRGCLGPGWRANATIGRAVRLVLVNCGGCPPGDIDKATHGMPGKYSFCFGELEEESPWEPLHVERGFAREQSAVTAIGGTGTHNILAFFNSAEAILDVISDAIQCYGSVSYLRAKGNPLVIITPGHAKIFAQSGWDKARIRHELFKTAQIPRSRMPYVGNQLLTAVYMNHAPEQMCLPCEKEEDIIIAVAGGPEAYHATYVPSFVTQLSTAEVILPFN